MVGYIIYLCLKEIENGGNKNETYISQILKIRVYGKKKIHHVDFIYLLSYRDLLNFFSEKFKQKLKIE